MISLTTFLPSSFADTSINHGSPEILILSPQRRRILSVDTVRSRNNHPKRVVHDYKDAVSHRVVDQQVEDSETAPQHQDVPLSDNNTRLLDLSRHDEAVKGEGAHSDTYFGAAHDSVVDVRLKQDDNGIRRWTGGKQRRRRIRSPRRGEMLDRFSEDEEEEEEVGRREVVIPSFTLRSFLDTSDSRRVDDAKRRQMSFNDDVDDEDDAGEEAEVDEPYRHLFASDPSFYDFPTRATDLTRLESGDKNAHGPRDSTMDADRRWVL